MLVHHAGDAVKSEAIEHVHVHVKPKIGQKETKDLVMTIIEETGIPKLMSAFYSFVKVKVVRAIEDVDA